MFRAERTEATLLAEGLFPAKDLPQEWYYRVEAGEIIHYECDRKMLKADEMKENLLLRGLLCRDTSGYSLIHYFAETGRKEALRWMLHKGVDIEMTVGGSTPLHFAVRYGRTAAVELLLENRANIEAKNYFNETALLIAAQCGHTEIVRLLLDNGADVDSKTVKGVTALHLAAGSDRAEVVKLLLENSATVDVQDCYGETALFTAAGYGFANVVLALLAKGANPNARNYKDNTVVDWAKINGRKAVAQLLIKS